MAHSGLAPRGERRRLVGVWCAARILLVAGLLLLSGCGGLPGLEGKDGDNIGAIGESAKASSADTYVNLAVEYLRIRNFSQALLNAKEALRQDSGSSSAHNVIALIYDNLGELENAEEHFRRALQLQPKNPYYRNAYGFHLCKRERYTAAEKEFLAALRNPLYTTPVVAWNNAGICALRNGEKRKAEGYFEKALKLDPSLAGALIEMAELSLEQGETMVARRYLRRYHQVAPQSPRSLWLGVRVARTLGDKNSAASYELKLRSDYPDSEEYGLLQGSYY